jgi:hypothetical protein
VSAERNVSPDPEGDVFFYAIQADSAFQDDKLRGRHWGRWNPPGYRHLIKASEPDTARIEAIEHEVAAGILRWLDRQKPGFAYDYWLIYFGLVDDEGTGTTETWPKLRIRLWADMGAGLWLDTRDCYGAQDRLWKKAVEIVYAQLFPRRVR